MIAVGAVVVVVLAVALLIKGCESSATTAALKSYNATVYTLIGQSDATGQNVFKRLGNGNLSGAAQKLPYYVQQADQQLLQARALHPPSQMAAAQTGLAYVMQLRAEGISLIAHNVQGAANTNTSKDAIYKISVGSSEIYASDVLYKTVVAPDLAKALRAAAIPVGPNAGQQLINPGQVVSDLGWLNTTWIATKVGAHVSTAQANINNSQPNLVHGDQLNYVTVGNVELSSSQTNSVSAASATTWTLSVTNSGQTAENAVSCSVSIQGANDTGTSSIPQIASGSTTTCTVTLPRTPPTGPYSVTAKIGAVPLETNVANNKATYRVTFN